MPFVFDSQVSRMSVPENVIIEKLTRIVEENLDNHTFSLDKVYKELGISRTHLHRIIKEQTQLSTTLYIRKIRLHKAKELLATTDRRIAEIADLIGIDSPQNFSKYFFEEFAVSPTEFRKQKNIPAPMSSTFTVSGPMVQGTVVHRSDKNYRYVWAGIFLAIWFVIGGYFWKSQVNSPSAHVLGVANYNELFDNSVAILPFKSDANGESLAEGVMEEIHGSLSLIENLKVIARRSSNEYKDSRKTARQIGAELQVAYILQGRVDEKNNKAQVALELVRTQDGITVWTKNQEGNLKNFFNLMNEVIKELALELNQKITPELANKLDRIPTKNAEAYNEFLQGRLLMIERTQEKLAASIQKFERALALDPDFAEAYAYKAIASHLRGNMGYADMATSGNAAEQNALKAIQLDAQNATAYATLGNVYRDQFKWQQAKTSYTIALKYRPNDAQTIYWYSLLMRSMGRPAEALQYSAKAMAIDPLYPVILGGHVLNCAYAGRYDLAEKSIKDGQLIFDDSFVYYMARGYYYLIRENYAQALKEFKKVQELNPNMKYFNTLIYYCEARQGNKTSSVSYLKSLGNHPQDYLSKSMVYAGMGKKDSSMVYLQKAADLGVIHSDILVNPTFKIHRKDPRFEAIIRKFDLTGSKSLPQ